MRLPKTDSVLQIRDLPTPKGHLLLGHLLPFQQGPKHMVLEKWAEECGSIYRIRLGFATFVVSADPQFNADVLKQRPEGFRRHPKISEILEEIGVYSVFNAEGARWYEHRKPVAEALNLKKVKSFYPLLLQKTEQLMQQCQLSSRQQDAVEVRSLVQRFTLDLTTAIAFGYPLNTLGGEKDELHDALQLVFPMVNKRMSAAIPVWRWWKSHSDREFDNALRYIRSSVQRFIDTAKSTLLQGEKKEYQASNFLEALLLEQRDHKLDEADVFSAVFTLLLAGEDTTANSIAWALFLLAQQPSIVEELRGEAIQVYGEALVPSSIQQHQQLRLAEAVALEVIRLKPTSPQLILQAQSPVEVCGLELPAGTNVILQNRIAQVQEKYFSEADAFRPHRWLTEQCPAGIQHQPEIVRTFGGGARYCPGKHLAMHEMVIVISSICKQFDIQMAEAPSTIAEAYTFTMHPESFRVRLRSIR
ncbi:MAG: cytochrome P450 [Bacteroidota bacterium]